MGGPDACAHELRDLEDAGEFGGVRVRDSDMLLRMQFGLFVLVSLHGVDGSTSGPRRTSGALSTLPNLPESEVHVWQTVRGVIRLCLWRRDDLSLGKNSRVRQLNPNHRAWPGTKLAQCTGNQCTP